MLTGSESSHDNTEARLVRTHPERCRDHRRVPRAGRAAEAEAGWDLEELRRRAVPPAWRDQVRAAAETVIEVHGEALERLATSEE